MSPWRVSLPRLHETLASQTRASVARVHAMVNVGSRSCLKLVRFFDGQISDPNMRFLQRVFSRTGPVLSGRYHVRPLRTPLEVRRAIAYVLLNARKHWRQRTGRSAPVRLDEASSGFWFDGWSRVPPGAQAPGPRDVAPARTWLLRRGWRSRRLIDPAETPG